MAVAEASAGTDVASVQDRSSRKSGGMGGLVDVFQKSVQPSELIQEKKDID